MDRRYHAACALAVLAGLAAGCGPGATAQSPPPSTVPTAAPAPAATSAARILTEKPLYSQSKEELVIRNFFKDRRQGFFVDVGCASPIANSNTYYLEHHLGWTGIGVDALAEYAPAWKQKRPGSRFFAFLVSDHSDTVDTFYRSELRGISSVQKRNIAPGGDAVKWEEMKVPTTTLNKLLDQNGVTRIDFLNMDIEGHEPPALAGFDIDRFKPELVCIEAKPENREKIMKYFTDHRYRRLKRYIPYDEVNYYFAAGAETP
jgi:FkbM family methyltransferase